VQIETYEIQPNLCLEEKVITLNVFIRKKFKTKAAKETQRM
jgi:hypothetical protein